MCFTLLLIFLFMIYANPLVPALNADHAIHLVGIAAMVILMIQKMVSKEKLQFQWPESYLMLGLVGAAGLSCFAALSPKVAVATTSDLAKIAIVYFLIINVADRAEKVRMAMVTMVAGGLFPTIGILQNYLSGNAAEGVSSGWIGKFEDPKVLACGLVVLVPLTIQLIREARPMVRPFLAAVSVLYVVAIFASGSQAGVFGLLAALLVMGLRQSRMSLRLLTPAVLAGTVLLIGSHWTTEARSSNPDVDFAVHRPNDTVRTAANIFRSHPILGVGLGCLKAAWPAYAGADAEFSNSRVTHNTIVQALGEIGVVGFIPFALLLVMAFIHCNRMFRSRVYDQSTASAALGLEGALVGFLVYGMFGSYLVSWPPYILLGLVSALSLIVEGKGPVKDLVQERVAASSKCAPSVLEGV